VRIFSFLLVAPVIAGCSANDWATVSGTVLLDGKPLPKGVITFHHVDEEAPATGQIVAGAFSVQTGIKPGLKTGKYVVTVVHLSSPSIDSGESAKLLTPEKYANVKTSDLNAVVASGENTFKFEMKSSTP
jgi:hypothetical protein